MGKRNSPLKAAEKKAQYYTKSSTLAVYLALRGLVILTLVRSALRFDFESVFLCGLTLILLVLPSIFTRALKIELPGTLEVIVLLFIFAAEILGEINSFYVRVPNWDTILHTMNGFLCAAIGFALVYFVKLPVFNIIFMVFAIMSSNCAASMLWSRYCPSLRDTGMVSSATGFLDFVSYMSAAASSTIFANAVSGIGWQNLILVWFGLMVCGILVAIPRKSKYAMPDPK